MLAQGIPFIHAGQESLGTKGGNDNSYNSAVEVNEINWERVKQNKDLVDYFKQLVNLRKGQSVFRQNDYASIARTIKVLSSGTNGIFAFEYDTKGQKMYVAFNVNDKIAKFDSVDFSNSTKLLDSDGNVKLDKVTNLMPLSTLVVVQKNKADVPTNSDIGDSINSTNADTAGTVTSNTTNIKSGVLQITLTHNAYVYEKDGTTLVKNGNKAILLRAGTEISALNHGKVYTLNGKQFYRIDVNQYVKVSNTISYYVLKHNSFVYSRKVKAIKKNVKRLLLKRGQRIDLHNARIIRVNGKRFYMLKSGNLVKARNIKHVIA
ncbi:SLAP domain-containing protein [Lactobacillus helveticus]|nr:SLAP domain-containing protein [Lactobacillus helveticus]